MNVCCCIAEETIEFVRQLQNVVVSELPGTATFECSLSRPNVRVQWLKAGKPIMPDHKYDVKMDGAVHRLVVRDVTGSDDVTEYTATVRGLASKAALELQGETTRCLSKLTRVSCHLTQRTQRTRRNVRKNKRRFFSCVLTAVSLVPLCVCCVVSCVCCLRWMESCVLCGAREFL